MKEEKVGQDEGEKRVLELVDRLAAQKRVDVDRNWAQLERRIHKEEQRMRWYRFIRSAAAILLLPALLLSGFLYYHLRELQQLPAEQVELTTAYGMISKIILSDGSEVWLNSGSKLVYPQRFVGKHREVYLSGEAYFKVKSDSSHRFDVKTSDGITVSAYGTEFNVQAYADESRVEATLAEGNITVEQPEYQVKETLKPGEQLRYFKKDRQTDLRAVNLSAETAWREGKILFRRTSMKEVARQLSRHFNVDIQLQGQEICDYSYSATFTTETLTEILSLLEKTAPIQCEIIEPEQQSDYAFSRKRVVIRPL